MGFHFGTKDQAEFRGKQYDFQSRNPHVGEYYLSIQNPLEVTHMESFAPDHLADKMMDMGILTDDRYQAIRDRYSEEPEVGDQLVKILKKEGYDGLKYSNDREGEGTSYVPFDSTQIKSTDNKGTFDPSNPDVGFLPGTKEKLYHAERQVGDEKEGPSLGKFYTDNEQTANSLADLKGNVTEHNVELKKPLSITPKDGEYVSSDEFNQILKDAGVKYKVDDIYADDEVWRIIDSEGKPLINAIKKAGYDSAKYPEFLGGKDQTTTLVFDPKAEEGFLPSRKQPEAEAKDNEFRISTMRPWGKPGDSFVEEGQHTVSAAPFFEKPKLTDKAANFYKEQGYLGDLIDKDPKKTLENVTKRIVDNLLWLHDKFKPELRDEAKKWYDGARKISERWAEEYGHPRQAVAAVMAALSPQLDWFQNVSLAKRVLDIYRDQQDTKWTPEMDKQVDRIANLKEGGIKDLQEIVKPIRGRAFKDLNTDEKAVFTRLYDEAHHSRDYEIVSPSGEFMGTAKNDTGKNAKVSWRSLDPIEKAIASIEDPTLEGISYNMGTGHKVRNFYNNIILPNAKHGDVTIDTHAVAAALLMPFAAADDPAKKNFGGISNNEGTKGMYGIYADAYRQAAEQRGLLPREMQSITWEAVRGLFTDVFKTQANKDAIREIWEQVAEGNITREEALDEIFEAAGGIKTPSWAEGRRGDAPNEKGGDTSDQGPLSKVGVHGRSGGRAGRGGGSKPSGELAGLK